MPFVRPDLESTIARNDAQISSRLGIGPLLRRAVLGVLSRVLGGGSHQMHGHLDWISNQILPDTADAEILDRHSTIWGVSRKSSVFATGNLDVTFSSAATVLAGTVFRRPDGVEYETSVALTALVAGTLSVAAVAVVASADANADAGVTATLSAPIAGVTSEAVIATGGMVAGADTESDVLLSGRIVDRITAPPHGGNENDYAAWALEISDVTRAWVFPLHLGIGTVGVTFTTDDLVDGPIPLAAKVAEVQAYIDDPGRRPVTAAVTVFAPTPVALDFSITITPDTSAIRAAVEASLAALLRRDAIPGGTILISRIREAISTSAGESDHVLSVPAADVTHGTGELATMGAVTWL